MYEENLWNGQCSRSGAGSEGVFAEEKVALLDDLIARYDIQSIVDLGCGDVQKHPRFLELGLVPVWQTKGEYPGDFFELYALPSGEGPRDEEPPPVSG